MNNTAIFENALLPNLGKTAKLTGYFFNDTFHKNGIDLSREQWLVLKKLYANDCQIQNDLASITDRSKTSLTRLINTMEKKGLVYRVLSIEDRRINHIHLSDFGKQTFLVSLPVLKKMVDDLEEDMTEV